MDQKSFGKLIPIGHVIIYFAEKGSEAKEAIAFYKHYKKSNYSFASK